MKQSVVYRGDTVQADAIARYQYGTPLASRPIEVALPDGRTLHGTTDAAGKYHVEFATEGFAEEQMLQLTARLPQDNVSVRTAVRLAVRGFEISLSTTRDVYLDGESFPLRVITTDALGNPIGESLSATLVKQVTSEGKVTERDLTRKPLVTDPKTGRGSVALRADDPQGGQYLLRVAGTDRFGTAIVADRAIFISGKKDETKLRLLADRQRYKVGEEASVRLHSRDRAGTALFTWEADRILSYRLVTLKEGDNAISWAIDGAQFPNFTLTSTRMWQNECDQARLDIQVDRDLRVTVTPARPIVGPGEPIELDVRAVDQLGRPASAELSIAMVDQSLLRLFRDPLPEIGPFFYNQTRTGAFGTEATNTFRYEPSTVAVSQAVVDEADRMAAVGANAIGLAGVLQEADSLALNAPKTPAAATPPLIAPTFAAPSPPESRPLVEGTQGGGRGYFESKDSDFADKSAKGEAVVDGIRYAKNFRDLSSQRLGRRRSGRTSSNPNEPPSREKTVETAYWNPSVVTDKDGKARITFKAPSALSEYRITARGITGSDTLAGQTTSTVTVRRNFFVNLKVPGSLTRGDKPRFIAQVHHTGVQGAVALRLAIYAGDRDDVLPRTIDLKGDGVDEVMFEPFEVPEGDSVRLTLTGNVGDLKDELILEIPIRPWGLPVMASASGTGSESTTVFLGLPAGRTYENPDMRITISPSLSRMLIEVALGRDAYANVLGANSKARLEPMLPPDTTADRAADLLAATSALRYLREARATSAPEAQRLTERIQGLVAELVSSQKPDGGWAWVSEEPMPSPNRNRPPALASDRLTSAAVFWALASAEPLGLSTDPKVLDQGVAYLNGEFSKLGGGDFDARAALLHALSARRAASFEAANSVNRARNNLSDSALAYLALTFANLDRASMAGEVLDLLGPRAKTEATAPGRTPRLYWDRGGRLPFIRSASDITALVTLAYARVRPQAPELDRAVEWLQAHRVTDGWLPHKAKGPALAALASYYGRARAPTTVTG